MTWRRGMKKLASILALIDASRLRGWGWRNEDCCWLDTLRDRTQNQSQWRQYNVACLHHSFLLNIIHKQSKHHKMCPVKPKKSAGFLRLLIFSSVCPTFAIPFTRKCVDTTVVFKCISNGVTYSIWVGRFEIFVVSDPQLVRNNLFTL